MKEVQHPMLSTEIIQDLFTNNKIVMLLILLLLITSLGTIWVTNTTRLLTSDKNSLVLEKQALENELVNLRLENTILAERSRIESLAIKKLKMHPITKDNEIIISE